MNSSLKIDPSQANSDKLPRLPHSCGLLLDVETQASVRNPAPNAPCRAVRERWLNR
ncbi:MAG: hypothetical protein V7K40_15895 [Nostoc sp.]